MHNEEWLATLQTASETDVFTLEVGGGVLAGTPAAVGGSPFGPDCKKQFCASLPASEFSDATLVV